MSGDVQPRKRKDKKRKKDDSTEDIVYQFTPPTAIPSDDVNIHVHKEISTGGGICAKFVFFILLAILAVLIGLIITEHRGLTDLDTVNTESRYSQIFDGWTDESTLHDDHDDEQIENSTELSSHEEEEEEVGEDEENTDSKEAEHDDEEDEVHESEEVQSVMSDEDTQENDIEDETIERTEEDEDDAEEEEEEEEEQQYTNESNDDDQTIETDTLEDNEENDDEESVEQSTKTYEQESDEASYNDEEQEEQTISEEAQTIEDEDDTKSSGEDEEVQDVEDAKQTSTEDTEMLEETNDITEDEQEEEQVNEEANKIGVVKIGVGVSLLVVAYVVLVRKWKTDKINEPILQENEATPELVPDLSRRNTIVVPPSLDVLQQELESEEEDYSEEDEEDEIESEEDVKIGGSAKRQYQELRNVYTRSLTPEEEIFDKETTDDLYDEDQDDIEYVDEQEDADVDEDEEEEDDIEEGDEIDDEEDLLKRLEAKYGKIRHSDEEEENDENDENKEEEDYDDYEKIKTWKRGNNDIDSDSELNSKSGARDYHLSNITNVDDWNVREDLDDAQDRIPSSPADALNLFNKILKIYPHSPRALYGKAMSLDLLAEKKQSNEILQAAIDFYLKTVNSPKVPESLFKASADRCINRMRFIGYYGKAIYVHKLLIEKFPDVPEYPNQLAVTYLTINKVKEAKNLLFDVLSKWPNNGFALVHYGFILKTNDNNINEAIFYLQKGINSKAAGVIDGRFYFHLGDALTRLGKNNEAYKLYEDGVLNNVFLSKYQRSLYNVNGLTGKPWWSEYDLPLHYQKFFNRLKNNWKIIRDEGLVALNRKNTFKDEAENLRDVGDWKQFELFARGSKYVQNCQKCPRVCEILQTFPDASKCRRGQIKFSVMEPGTHVWPHCGPTNCRLRLHLGLKVPQNTYIRVAKETRTWKEGEIFIFDDSFEHEVWHNGSDFRLVLIVDMWHPELTPNEKSTLSAI